MSKRLKVHFTNLIPICCSKFVCLPLSASFHNSWFFWGGCSNLWTYQTKIYPGTVLPPLNRNIAGSPSSSSLAVSFLRHNRPRLRSANCHPLRMAEDAEIHDWMQVAKWGWGRKRSGKCTTGWCSSHPLNKPHYHYRISMVKTKYDWLHKPNKWVEFCYHFCSWDSVGVTWEHQHHSG